MARDLSNRCMAYGFMTLVVCAGGIVAHEACPQPAATAQQTEFQSLVGGLGLGSGVDVSQCSFSFDPRLERSCPHGTGPIPAGFCLCSEHMSSVTVYSALPPPFVDTEDAESHAAGR